MEPSPILYIEDEPDYQVLVSGILAEAGLTTELADTGEQGLDRLSRKKPSLVLLDVNLPDTSGYALCKRLREEEAWADIPVIMLTVRRRPNEWLEGFSKGADDYLSKPFNPPELIERVQAILSGKPDRRLNPKNPEHLLIEAALAGNRSAFQVLITQYKAPLMNYVRQTVRNPVATDDIVAASFARAFQYLERFRGDCSFFTWLYTITDNQIHDHWLLQNRIGPQPPSEEIPVLEHPMVEDSDETNDAEMGSAIRRLRKAVEDLPSEFRQPVSMHCIHGIPVDSVARRLRVPLGTVLSRIFRGKKLLRESFAKQPDSETT